MAGSSSGFNHPTPPGDQRILNQSRPANEQRVPRQRGLGFLLAVVAALGLIGNEPFMAADVPSATEAQVKAAAKSGKPPVTRIAAAIFCERASQKGILIGKQGAMLKRIGTEARHEIETMLGTRVMLELFVKVERDWRDSNKFLDELDWRRQLEDLSVRPVLDE